MNEPLLRIPSVKIAKNSGASKSLVVL